ncbi:MAG: ParB/RepB/Spo0J family partition protein [Deltaproteobacteria bacterium]|nr:ParB/RepB/Spo0J family partition protein [Deltaproteobacteria bacterium]MBW2353351.1 ParB/RepB/Spo0J family partition protein [Deltaproteobacteria bacterium]HDZ89261.1 ParB/RepB/Spo0J family partition protein [Deltaproteobacteria bacterium]
MAKRKALGKGLSALIPDADQLDSQQEEFFQCPVEAIEPNPYQPRQEFSAPELEEMVASVREKGIITPLLVSRTETGYQLIAGERRWRAAQKAGLRRVPVVVREATPTESLELALIENIHRKDLNPIEEAVAYGKLLEETGITQEALATRLGKDRSSITNLLRLLKLPLKIQQDVIDGRLSTGHARLLAGFNRSEDQWSLRNKIIKKGLSVRQAEALARRAKGATGSRGKKPPGDHYLRSLEDSLKRSLGTKVEIRKRGKRGTVVVHFYSDDELDRLLERLG